eukprot:3004800-Prymnesium_polylepis.1
MERGRHAGKRGVQQGTEVRHGCGMGCFRIEAAMCCVAGGLPMGAGAVHAAYRRGGTCVCGTTGPVVPGWVGRRVAWAQSAERGASPGPVAHECYTALNLRISIQG